MPIVSNKGARMFIILGGIFITNALVAEFVGVKIFALEESLGLSPFNWNLFGQEGSLNFTAGVLLWPIVFIMTDIINEYYGKRGVRFLSFLTAGLIAYSFLMVFISIHLSPAGWWRGTGSNYGVPDMQNAFQSVFGQSNWIIVGSLTAFCIGQVLDSFVFEQIRKKTGDKYMWLRATGSTLISQFVDSFVVLYIAFVLGPQHWSMGLFLAVGVVNYCYKFLAAIVLTPALYFVHSILERYLGKELAEELKKSARM